KTTFLKVLHGLLSQEEGILIDAHVQEAEIYYKEIEDDSSTSRSPKVQVVTVKKSSFLTVDESLQYDWDEFNTSI
ncbi:hypothetical protein CGJ31_24525, partial [Vibrio parahaemolyticus]